ncbi:MAG: hypothetical protein JW929_02220 [Anaerolineales bacterium]|nr:hypothetical protein [Anaerolineales bacterium]
MSVQKRYPLILYREWMRSFSFPILFLMSILGVLWAAALSGWLPEHVGVYAEAQAPVLGAATGIAFVLWLTVLILPHLAYVQCHPDYLLLRTGPLRLIVSYSRVRTSRSVQHLQIHSPKTQPRAHRKLAVRLALTQCVAIELTSYPSGFFLLRALSHPFLFLGDEPGFLFAVKDWMGLNREVDEKHAALLARKRDAQKQPRLGALS